MVGITITHWYEMNNDGNRNKLHNWLKMNYKNQLRRQRLSVQIFNRSTGGID